MGRGTSKAGGGSVGSNVISLNKENTLESLQRRAQGTPAEKWYKESGQSYEQLRAMENIYDIAGTTKNVKSFDAVEKDANLSKAMGIINDAPNGTIVSYQINNKNNIVMKKNNLGQWTSYEIFSPSSDMSVVMGGSLKKYTPIQALNTFTTLQSGALRKTLNANQMKAFKGYM